MGHRPADPLWTAGFVLQWGSVNHPPDGSMADRRLQVFHAVAKHLSFTKAAEALFMTQPAVTFQIRQLEEHFNTRLFDRGHGRISLTAAGNLALEYAERILEVSAELDSRLQEMSGQLGGPLLIGASTTIADYLLPPCAGRLQGALSGRRAAALRGQLGSGAEPRRRAQPRHRLHRRRLAFARARDRRLLRGRAAGHLRAFASAGEARIRDARVADAIRQHQPRARVRARARSSITTCRRRASRPTRCSA